MYERKSSHAFGRLRERSPWVKDERLRQIISLASKKNIPKGHHHVALPGGSAAVLRDIGRKHVVATVLGPGMRRPGRDLTAMFSPAAFTRELAKMRERR